MTVPHRKPKLTPAARAYLSQCGQLAKGIKKKITNAERLARAKRLAKVRKKRWPNKPTNRQQEKKYEQSTTKRNGATSRSTRRRGGKDRKA